MKRLRIGFRGKLFLVSLALVVVAALASVLYLEAELRDLLRTGGAAHPAEAYEDAVSRVRLAALVGAGVGVLVALFMSGLAAHFMARAMRDLVQSARAVARGERAGRLPADSDDELGGLAGSFNQLVGSLDDAARSLARERDHFQAVLESMREAVIALDAGQKVTLVNRVAVDWLFLGASPLGRTLLEVVRVRALKELADGALLGEQREVELDLPARGASRRVHAHAAPLAAGRGCILVLYDVTELRRLERVRRDFVTNVSHELRTPVAIVRANAETLLEGALYDEDRAAARRFTTGILRNAERLTHLITGLLDISRLEAGQVVLTPRPIDLRAAAERAVAALAPLGESRTIEVAIAVPAGLRARADDQALDQILTNLLDNALKYTPAGGHVTVSAAAAELPSGPAVALDVTDDGPGIDPRHRARIFERFYRVDHGRARTGDSPGGTGLGLAIVKHLTEAMGGSVAALPALPHGSRFRICLPAALDRHGGDTP